MKTFQIHILILLSSVLAGLSAQAMGTSPCAEAYFEGVHLDRVETQPGLVYGKVGYCVSRFQLGLVARVGGDSRTATESSSAVYNDNYGFVGAGVALPDALPGVRLLVEGGYSFDLSPKIHRRGPDFRGGWMSYHETFLPLHALTGELYSEGLYVHRYRNFISSLQPRLFWGLLKPAEEFVVGPVAGLNLSYDTAVYNYNRFLEINYGLKGKWLPHFIDPASGFSFGAQVYGVRGFRTERNTELPAYSDFRVLFFGYFSFSPAPKENQT